MDIIDNINNIKKNALNYIVDKITIHILFKDNLLYMKFILDRRNDFENKLRKLGDKLDLNQFFIFVKNFININYDNYNIKEKQKRGKALIKMSEEQKIKQDFKYFIKTTLNIKNIDFMDDILSNKKEIKEEFNKDIDKNKDECDYKYAIIIVNNDIMKQDKNKNIV